MTAPHLDLLDELLLVKEDDFHMEGLDDGPAAHLEALLHAPHPRSLLIPHPRPPPVEITAGCSRPARGSAGDWAGAGNTVHTTLDAGVDRTCHCPNLPPLTQSQPQKLVFSKNGPMCILSFGDICNV